MKTTSTLIFQFTLTLISAVGCENVWSQTAAPSQPTADAGLEEIVVTAQRRPDTLQRTPLAIDALSAQDLIHQDINDARDLGGSVPALHVSTLGIYNNVYINGVGGGVSNAYGSPAVSYSIGGVFIDQASGAATPLFDLERVEIVKGPQGTLYGRNATAGALNVVPNKPSFTDEGEVSLRYGNYDDIEASGMANIPLSDTIATRFSFISIRHEGYLSNGANDEDSQAGRAQILWKASDDLTLLAYADYFHEGGRGVQSVPLNPGVDESSFGTGAIAPGLPPNQKYLNNNNPWQAISNNLLYPSLIPAPYPSGVPLAGDDQGINHNQAVVHLQADWNLGFATATILPAFVQTNDNDIFYQAAFRANEVDNIDQYTVEARLASNADQTNPLQWVGGVYYFRSSGSSLGRFFQQGVSDIDLSLPSMTDESKAVFGQLTYAIFDALRLTGGIRYTKESKTESGQTIVGNIFLAPPPTPATCATPFTYYAPVGGGTPEPARCGVPNAGDLSFGSTDYKAGIEYDLSSQSLLYANYSTGFKAGGFNPGSPPNTYEPEKLTDYDIGTKNRFFDNKIQLNGTAFYWSYVNQQSQAFGPINPAGYAYIVYPSKSHIYGASIDVSALVTEADKVGAQVVYQYGVYDEYQTLSIPALGIVGVNGAGAIRPYTPKWTEQLDYSHTFSLSNSAKIVFDLNTNIVSRQYIYTTPDVPLAWQGFYHKTNMTLGYHSPDSKWLLEAYANNVENTFTMNSLQPSSTTGNFFAYVDPPRTYGMRISRKF